MPRVSRLLLSFVLAVPLWSSVALAAGDWSGTFTGAAGGMELDGKKVLLLAGSKGEESAGATQALLKELRGSGKLALLLDADTVGDFAGKKDPGILKRTAGMPVELRLILRVFDGDPPTVVVSVYDSKSALLGAHSGERGKAMFATAGDATGGLGLAGKAADDTVEAVSSIGKERNEAVDRYAERFLWVGTNLQVSQQGAYAYDVVFQGKYKKSLTRRELYTLLDAPEIMQRVEKSKADTTRGQAIMLGGGTVATALFTAAAIWGFWQHDASREEMSDHDYGTPEYEAADTMSTVAMLTGITAAVLAGTALIGVGGAGLALLFPPDDDPAILEQDELRRRVEGYNEKLRAELGLEGVEGLPTGI